MGAHDKKPGMAIYDQMLHYSSLCEGRRQGITLRGGEFVLRSTRSWPGIRKSGGEEAGRLGSRVKE